MWSRIIEELGSEHSDLHDALDSIADIVSPPPADDDSGDDGPDYEDGGPDDDSD